MTCSTSSSSRTSLPRAVLVLLLLPGCALLERRSVPAIEIASLVPIRNTPIAVLPIENLSGERAPLEAIVRQLRAELQEGGLRLVDDQTLERFLQRHRIRVASGLSRDEARGVREATGAGAVVITTLATYRETPPPEISMFSRLVSSGDEPEILWMNSVGLSGEDGVGLLGIGRIRETDALLEKVIHRLTASLAASVLGGSPRAPVPDAPDPDAVRDRHAPAPGLEDAVRGTLTRPADAGLPGSTEVPQARASSESSLPAGVSARYAPRAVFRSAVADPRGSYSVAVIPFVNESERENAGRIMALHLVEELCRFDGLRVVDPGLVREEMLRYRIVIPEGPSLATADLLSGDRSLGVDLLISGTVFDYGGLSTPKVEFSLGIVETASREVVWTSRSYNHGQEGVFFLDAGRVYTAHRLAADMVRAAIREFRH